jgi:hypothetical protein
VWLTLAFNPAAADALPFAVTLMGLLFMNFCILTTIGVISGSELWSVVGIIATNTSVPVFMTAVSPMLASASDGSMAVWRGPVAVILLTELLITVLALGSAFYVLSRRTDFVQGGSA